MKRRVLAALLGCLCGAAPANAIVAVYDVTFDATWSQGTHPVNFPANAHFSGLVGGTHDETLVFWEPGGLASPGIEVMAESGIWQVLFDEVAAAGGSPIHGSNIPLSPDSRTFQILVDEEAPLVTLVSMVAPSPDWFVGVDSLPLWENTWVHQIVVDLPPYDAGTDSGPTFLSPNADTQPQEPIAELTGFPFTGTGPLGTFTFTLVPGCRDGIDNDGDGLIDFDGGGVGDPDPRCVGFQGRVREDDIGCGLLGVEPLLVVAPLWMARRKRRAREEAGLRSR